MTDDAVVELGHFRLWIDGRESPDAQDFWDGNWLAVRAEWRGVQSTVFARGPLVHLADVYRFRAECEALLESLVGSACLAPLEPNLRLELGGDGKGHVSVTLELTPNHMTEAHTLRYELDQTYLPPLIAALSDVLKRFPIREPEKLPPSAA